MSHSSLARIRRHLQPSAPVNIAFSNTYTSHQQPNKHSLLYDKTDNDTFHGASGLGRGGSGPTAHSLHTNFNELHSTQFPLRNAVGDQALQPAEINDLIHTPLDQDHVFESWRHVREQQYQYEQKLLQGRKQEKNQANHGPIPFEETNPPDSLPQARATPFCKPDLPSQITMVQEEPVVVDTVQPDCLTENADRSRSTGDFTSFEDSSCTSCGYSCSQSDSKIYDYASSSMTVTSAASSTWEGHEHDFDKQATISVQEMLEELEAYLYRENEDSPGQNITLVDECQEWSTLFPHLRIKGYQLVPPTENGVELIPNEEVRCHSPYFFLPYVKPGAYKGSESVSPTNRDRTIPFSAGFYGGMQRAPSPPRTPPSSPPLSRRTGTSDLEIMICGIKLPDQAMKKTKVRNKEGDSKTKVDKKKVKNNKASYNVDANINLKHGVWSCFDWSDEALNEAVRKFWTSKADDHANRATDTKVGDVSKLQEASWIVIGHHLSQYPPSEPVSNNHQNKTSTSPSPTDLDGPRCTTPTRKNPHTLMQANAVKSPKSFAVNVPPECQHRPVIELIAKGEGGFDALNQFAASTGTDNSEQWNGYVRFGIVLVPRPVDILWRAEPNTVRRNAGFTTTPLGEDCSGTLVIVDLGQEESGRKRQQTSVTLSDEDIFLAMQDTPYELCSVSISDLSKYLSESSDKISVCAKLIKKLNLIRSETPMPATLDSGEKGGEEIWASHGVLDEWFAVDKLSEDLDSMDRLGVNVRRKGFPPLTPSANVRQAVLDHIFDDVWAEVIPILQPLIQSVIGEGGMPFDISDSNEARKASKVEALQRHLMDEGDATNYQPILDRERLLSAMTIRPAPLQKRREASASTRRGIGGEESVNELQQPAAAYGLQENGSQQQGYLRAQTAGGQSNNGPSTGPFLPERRNISGSAWKRYSATASRLIPLVPVVSSNTAASSTNANQLSDVLFGTSIGPIKSTMLHASRPSTSHGKRLPPIKGNPNQDTGQHPASDGPFVGALVDGGSNLSSTPLAFIPGILNSANATIKAGRHIFFDASDATGISQDFGRLRSETPRLISSARRQLSSASTRGRSSYGYSRPHTAFTNIDETFGISKTSTHRTVNAFGLNSTRNNHLGSMSSSMNDVTSTSLASISSTGESEYRLYHEMDPCGGMKDRSIRPVFGMGIKTLAGNETNKYPLTGHRKTGHAHY